MPVYFILDPRKQVKIGRGKDVRKRRKTHGNVVSTEGGSWEGDDVCVSLHKGITSVVRHLPVRDSLIHRSGLFCTLQIVHQPRRRHEHHATTPG